MTAPSQENQAQTQATEQKPSDKELNFRALEAKYQRQLEAERHERLRLQQETERLMQMQKQKAEPEDDEDDTEPYVDKRRLNKTLARVNTQTQSEIQKAIEVAKNAAKEEVKQELWLESNPDFYDVLQHAEKFAQKAPKLAESILRMPEGFERQKLVYQNIKALGVDKPEQKQSTIQEKVNQNQRNLYYVPGGTGTAPYNMQSDFSAGGQKKAYEKLQELKRNLRLG